ncbi:Wilms tumor protein 1-interacting protein isoform A [Alligator mississippiensis]|uniref:Wilms tumor protein 1-interacting protein isoform A n=3 Tax=Alligator TaxID=8495 RepID=A0A151N747_ALLMI|nr:Wilms tumor protein 1-interacting protein isoform A [Alligator mississippiensis]
MQDLSLHEAGGEEPRRGRRGEEPGARSEVALPCYGGKRYEPAKYRSPRASLADKRGSPRASLAAPGPERYPSPRASLGPLDLSPRSSYASTAGDASKHSSPRASLAGSDGSKPSSNRTSGISLGYDQRRASTASQHSGCSDCRPGAADLPAAALGSPRSSISSHSSRGSLGAYPELQLPSPRASLLGPDEAGEPPPGLLLPSYACSPGKGSSAAAAAAPRFKLPFQVTPSRESGPSQAERRLEALTLELEKELEMHMKKEYFGICIKCGKGVYGASQACQAMGNLYHTNCFTCCSCGRRLRGKAFYNVNGKVYCEEDFLYSGFQQTADKCFVCGHLIMEMILQALGKSYHPGCFRCVVCNECLDGVPFTVDVENNIYCVKDYHTVFAPKCASCNQPILPAQGSEETIRVVSMDKDYHVECYHCEDCGLQLNDEEGHRCYPLEGHLLCHGCHIRRLNIKVPPHPPPSYPMHVTEL